MLARYLVTHESLRDELKRTHTERQRERARDRKKREFSVSMYPKVAFIVCFMFKFYARLNLGSLAYIVSHCAFTTGIYVYRSLFGRSSWLQPSTFSFSHFMTMSHEYLCAWLVGFVGFFCKVNARARVCVCVSFHMCAHLVLIDSSSFEYIGKIASMRSHWKLSRLNLSLHIRIAI